MKEFASIEEFKAQYTGEWSPSDGHWLGMDFLYNGAEYRFCTGSMYNASNTILEDGREAVFGLYRRNETGNRYDYSLLAEFSTIEDALACTSIGGKRFDSIIFDDNTIIIGQD